MDDLVAYIVSSKDHIATIAAQAHLQLVTDGNGKTARLLMNLLLLQSGYPLVLIDVQKRNIYIKAIQKAIQGDTADYYAFIYAAIEHSLDEYLQAAYESA